MVVRDSKGNRFNSLNEMMQIYGVNRKEAATVAELHNVEMKVAIEMVASGVTVRTQKYVEDHLGNRYKTKQEMCNAYGLSLSNINYFMKKYGVTLQEALIMARNGRVSNEHKPKRVCDHLGIEYSSVQEMCDSYRIEVTSYYRRMASGMDKEEALTGVLSRINKAEAKEKQERKHESGNVEVVVDHKGKTYMRKETMCKAYGVPVVMFDKRRQSGWSLAAALELEPGGEAAINYGNAVREYGTDSAEAIEILKNALEDKRAKIKRIQKNQTAKGEDGYAVSTERDKKLEAARLAQRLRQEKIKERKKEREHERVCGLATDRIPNLNLASPYGKVKDHKGNRFESLEIMARAYKVTPVAIKSRIGMGWPLEKALMTPLWNSQNKQGGMRA